MWDLDRVSMSGSGLEGFKDLGEFGFLCKDLGFQGFGVSGFRV